MTSGLRSHLTVAATKARPAFVRSSLLRMVARRLLQAIPLVIGIAAATFTLIHLAPGDPISALSGGFPLPDSAVAELRAKYGLDRPPLEQFIHYLSNLAVGDLGYSFGHRQPVIDVILSRAPATILLMGSSLVFAIAVGVPLGVSGARHPGGLVDLLGSGFALAGYSIPVFWCGQLLILLFSIHLGWLPASGMVTLGDAPLGFGRFVDIGAHLILPMFAISFRYIALLAKVTRTSMQDVLESDFMVNAAAKGLPARRAMWSHGLRNALLPVVTIVGYEIGFALSGSVLAETVFAWPGLGRLLYTAITARDTPLILGLFVVFAVTIIVVNIVTDIVYAYLDPRVSLEGTPS